MMTPTVTDTRRNGNRVGERVELGRQRVPVGEIVLSGQRVDSVVRFFCARGAVALVSARLVLRTTPVVFVARVWRQDAGEKRRNDQGALVGARSDEDCRGAVMSELCDFVKATGRGQRACGAGELFGPSAQLPLEGPSKRAAASTRLVLATCTDVASTRQ